MNNRTQVYVAAILSNPEFIKQFVVPLGASFYNKKDVSTALAEIVIELETAFEIPIHNGEPTKEDESNNLGP
jgi:hypothetical protein